MKKIYFYMILIMLIIMIFVLQTNQKQESILLYMIEKMNLISIIYHFAKKIVIFKGTLQIQKKYYALVLLIINHP